MKSLIAQATMLLAASCVGCSSQAALVKALAGDPATVSLRVTSVYGSLSFVRSGRTNGEVTIGPEGSVGIK